MDVFGLVRRLRDPDPRVRVEMLRILAMVEETRALAAIAWVYRHDPEPGVREVADWAGRLIHAAQQRGHSTQQAVEEMFTGAMSPERQESFLRALESSLADVGQGGHRAARRFAIEQGYQRRLSDAMQTSEQAAQDEALAPALPEPVQDAPAAETPSEPDDLLDAGLTDLFAE